MNASGMRHVAELDAWSECDLRTLEQIALFVGVGNCPGASKEIRPIRIMAVERLPISERFDFQDILATV